MNLLSLFSHLHSGAASPFAAPSSQAQSKSASVTAGAASSGATGSSGGSTVGANSASISANDFLTLLVTEIQNQDPTSQTDPMTYITQLVGVNSLEQLVQINSTLSSATTEPATTATGSTRTVASHAASSAAAAIQAAQSTNGPVANDHLLPLGVSGQATTASTNAVAQAFTHPAIMPQLAAPPTQVPVNPAVLRALEHSIPGAKPVGPASGAQ